MGDYEAKPREFLKEGKALDKERVEKGMESAVRLLHSLGLAHNDTNPSNVMVDETNSEPLLTDFGSCHKDTF